MTTLNISQKNVSDGKNTFFKNNKMLIGTEAPTSGTYTRGDVVINMGSDNDENSMWICTKSGSPGDWISIGRKPLITAKARVTITDTVDEVSIEGLGELVGKNDKLDVYLNSTYLLEDEDYTISKDGTKIIKNSGYWNTTKENAIFDFVLMKQVYKVDSDNITINAKTKLTSTVKKVQIVGTQTEVAMPNINFNQESDTLLVFKNGMIMINGIDYQISNGNLVSLTGPWNQSNVDDYEMTFILLKEVLVYEEETFGNFQEKIDDNLQTNDKTIVGAINELFQSANSGKELIASAIGEPLNAEDTFSAMSNDINNLLSTFKTNMMNSGVTIENGDKFKQLIDKILTLSDSSKKDLKFESGSSRLGFSFYGESVYLYDDEIILDFVPTYVFCHFNDLCGTGMSGAVSNLADFKVNNSDLNCLEVSIQSAKPSFIVTRVIPQSDEPEPDYDSYEWFAIGLSEEDTTFRDSLASILQGEGVDVTEEDDMASLISKVDEELDRQVVPAGDAVAANVLSGKTFINSTGQTVTGTMANRGGAQTVTPGTSNKTLNAGYYSGNITVAGDADLIAANIVSGKNIFGVAGTATIPTISAGTTYTTPKITTKYSNTDVGNTFKALQKYTCNFNGSVRVNYEYYIQYGAYHVSYQHKRGTTVVNQLSSSQTGAATQANGYWNVTDIKSGDVIEVGYFGTSSSSTARGSGSSWLSFTLSGISISSSSLY